MFDPQPHLIKLPRKVKDKATGHYVMVFDSYLEVRWRVLMFRERHPHGVITTEEICVDLDRGYARYKATVADGEGGLATGYGTETAADFADYCERAETRALGRALAALGIGTQFVGQDLTEGEHVADAPVRPATTHGDTPTEGTNGDTPQPTVVPTEGGLPCAGQAISTLKPAQLAMLVSKVARLVQDQGGRWVPLLHALQAERAGRLDRGQRRKVALVPPAEADVPDVPPRPSPPPGRAEPWSTSSSWPTGPIAWRPTAAAAGSCRACCGATAGAPHVWSSMRPAKPSGTCALARWQRAGGHV